MPDIYARRTSEVTEQETAHMALSRALAGECVVLLENDGALPLRESGRVALFGAGARRTIKGGTGSGDVNSRTTVSIEEGLRQAGFAVVTDAWMERQERMWEECRRAHCRENEEEAKRRGVPPFSLEFSNPFLEPEPERITEADLAGAAAEVAVYVISRNSGEGADRRNRAGDYLLSAAERENLTMLGARYEKTIVVLNIGGVMDLTELNRIEGINAVLLMSQLGNIGGHVLADVLTGAVNPSGKLTDTWAKTYADYPSSAGFSHNDGNVDDEYYTEGIYVGYRYFDTFGVETEYPFGYGLSYTRFALHTEEVTVSDGRVAVRVRVTNTGTSHAGKEVVQIYVSAPEGALEKPYQELAAFAKTGLLAPGESETLTLTFAVTELASYCEERASWVLEAGSYTVRVGNSSRATEAVAELALDRTVKTEEGRNLFPSGDLPEEIHPKTNGRDFMTSHGAAQGKDLILCELHAGEIPAGKLSYVEKRENYHTAHSETLTMADVLAGRCSVEELVSQLTVEEMAELCVGTLRVGEEQGSIVGNASHMVPGAAGDTTALLAESRGIKSMILADGPAGLRLTPHFKTTKDGVRIPGGEMIVDTVEPFATDLDESEVDDYYQYCTAIPIGWALAQSWNTELLERIGDMVGEEMEEYHVDLWLAPALNIHRNPLCGRNFEYYSEDPLVSGKTAAAITRGVQRHPGKGTTIKHFAVNSQEDNRYFTNSHVRERALREIYLKGFEIAVKESQPLAIMSSYNLINGVHTANSYDLLQAVARDEWGFSGVVMSDWFTSQEVPALTGEEKTVYPISASTGCIYAGNDLQMPGCQKNVDDIVKAVESGEELDGYRITLADLQFNAANVVRAAARTTADG